WHSLKPTIMLIVEIRSRRGKALMAKNARKMPAVIAKKTKHAKAKLAMKAKSRTGAKKKPAEKSPPQSQPKGATDKAASFFRTLVDAITKTDELRNKMEPPGTSEGA